jgi:hypothetical protein
MTGSQSLSSFAGNEPLVTPDWLIEDKLFRASDCQIHSFPPIEIDYDAVIHRLNVFLISIPPFRERPEDIPLLVRYFVRQFAQRMNKTIEAVPSETMEALSRYPSST